MTQTQPPGSTAPSLVGGREVTDTPDLGIREGWDPVQVPANTPFGNSYVSNEPDGDRVRIRFYQRREDGRVMAPVWFGPGCLGPPGHSHGGALAAVLDEVMGLTAWAAQRPVLLARLTTHNRAKVPLRRTMVCEAWFAETSGRKITVAARLVDPDGTVYVEGDGLFIDVGWDAFHRMLAEDGYYVPPTEPRGA